MIDKSHCILYEAMTIRQKSLIVNLLNLSSICVRRLLVLEGSWYIALHVCKSAKKLKVAVFTSFAKSQCCTGYPLIQVEIVSVCKSHYMYWLVSQSFQQRTFPCSWSVVAPVWLQVQVQVLLLQVQVLLLSLHFPRFLPFFLQNTELDTEVFGVVMKTRLGENLSTELCRTKFLSSL